MQILIWITPHFGTKSSGKPALAAEAAKSRNLCDRVFSVRQIGQTPHNSVFSHILADCHTCHLFENPTAGFSGQQCLILSILVYTFFSRMFDLMQPPAVKHSIAVV